MDVPTLTVDDVFDEKRPHIHPDRNRTVRRAFVETKNPTGTVPSGAVASVKELDY